MRNGQKLTGWSLITAVLLVGILAGCSALVPPAAATAAPTEDELKNATYKSEWTQSGTAPLTDGEYSEQAAPGSATKTVVKLTDHIAYGQLGDYQQAAAVVLVTDPGGSGTFYDLAVVVNQDGKPVNVASTHLGDRVKINSFSIENGEIVVDMITHGPKDPMCCPTQQVVQKYALRGDELVQTSSEVIGSAEPTSTATLQETIWALESYVNSQGNLVQALPDSEVTLELAVGKASGSAGCNNYFGTYTLDGNNLAIKVGGATMMFCEPEELMTQEQDYLAALGTAASYEITDNQLTIANAAGETVLTFLVLEPTPLVGTTWQLTAYNNGKGGITSVLAGTEITAVFGEDGMVAGSAGCNDYKATYEVTDFGIKVGPVASTRKMCSEPEGTMEQEAAYLKALESATAYEIRSDKLSLVTAADGVLLAAFQATDEGLEIVGVVWKWVQTLESNDTKRIPDDPSKYTLEFLPDGKVSIEADCNQGSGTYTINGQQISIEILITTLAACPPGSLEQEYIADLNAAVIYFTQDGDLYLDMKFDTGTMKFVKD